ncbi:MAG: GtrA family protein [Candidatus Spechtbacterales bacterium]
MNGQPIVALSAPRIRFSFVDILGAVVIGEAVAWLLYIMARVNAPQLPIPVGLADALVDIQTAFMLAVAFPLLSAAGLYVAYIIGRKIEVIYRAAKFALVGALNTFVDLGVLNALILATGVAAGSGFVAFAAISFTAAVINSYAWNKWWVFGSSNRGAGKEFSQFVLVSLVGIGLNVATAAVIVNVIGAPEGTAPELWANVGKLTATVVSLGWNFIGYKFWVFNKV